MNELYKASSNEGTELIGLKQYGLAMVNFIDENRSVEPFLSQEIMDALKQRISEITNDDLRKIRSFMTQYAYDPTKSINHPDQPSKNQQWAIFVGESVEDELMKRGLVRRGL